MRARNELDRLAAVWQPLLSDVEAIVGADEEERILERILSSPRFPEGCRRRIVLLLAGAATALATAAIAAAALTGVGTPRTTSGAQGRRATFALAGYRFKLPAGYTPSADTCAGAQFWGGLSGYHPGTPFGTPGSVVYSSFAGASADGGCLLGFLIGGGTTLPASATAVAVGSYKGFVAVAPAGSQKALFVEIPDAEGNHYLLLMSQALTTQQLISVAESGLPSGTAQRAQTCTADCG